jgi:hypothetical protein
MGAKKPIMPAYWGKDLNGMATDSDQTENVPDQTKPDLGDEIGDIAGKIWNAPNTILGTGYGGLGYIAGWPSKWLGLQKDAPGIATGNNAIQFTDNPLGGPSAITLGNTQTYGYKPATMGGDGNPMGAHEEPHTYQGQQLGPLYLPSNVLGGVAGLLIDGRWHGRHNWNEIGPQQHPPVPWPK